MVSDHARSAALLVIGAGIGFLLGGLLDANIAIVTTESLDTTDYTDWSETGGGF